MEFERIGKGEGELDEEEEEEDVEEEEEEDDDGGNEYGEEF